MNTTATRRLTGLLLIIVPLAFTALFTLLQVQFEYPDILRQPTADILAKFQAGGSDRAVVSGQRDSCAAHGGLRNWEGPGDGPKALP
jgi:hypothetical protein